MGILRGGRYAARFATNDSDLARAQALRAICFRNGAPDGDSFDARCRHVLVEHSQSGDLACTFRLLPLARGTEIGGSYAAQYYGLDGLESYQAPMVEMGRFCIRPGLNDPDVLRVAWGAMTAYVDGAGVGMLFGCSSFHGTEAEAFLDAFTLLSQRHLAPKRWLPRVKAPDVFRFARALGRHTPDLAKAMRAMPPLLRSYVMMGGWVSDHAVVDRDLGTLHVFTGLEIAAIPPARARFLRAATP